MYLLIFLFPFIFLLIFNKILKENTKVWKFILILFTNLLVNISLYINYRYPEIFIFLFSFQIINLNIVINKINLDSKKIILIYSLISLCTLIFFFSFTYTQNKNKSLDEAETDYKIFYPTEDNFSDTIQLASSIETIFSSKDLANVKGLKKNFISNNVYKIAVVKEICNDQISNPICLGGIINDTPRYYGLPPLYLFYIYCLGLFLKFVNNVTIFITILFIILSFIIYKILKNISSNYLIFFLITIFSYPYMFAYQRGNFVSLTVFILLLMLNLKLRNEKLNLIFNVVVLSIITNFRPNILLLVPLVLLNKSAKRTLVNSLTFIFSYLLITFSSFKFLENNLLNYNIETFKYNFLNYGEENLYQYVLNGDGFNNSFYSFFLLIKFHLQNIVLEIFKYDLNKILDVTYYNIIFLIIIMLSIFVYLLYITDKFSFKDSYTLLILFCLLISPKTGDYYLLLILIPLFNYFSNKNNYEKLILINCFLIIAPKPHSYFEPVYGISLGLFINVISMIIIILLLINKNVKLKKL